MRNSKKGMEIAINTVVILVLGIVLLGMGLSLVTKIIKSDDDATKEVNEQLMDEVRKNKFSDGSLVAVLNPYETINRGKSGFFLLGFVNKEKVSHNFKVFIKYSETSPIETELTREFTDEKANIDDDDYLLYLQNSIKLEPNQEHFAWIGFAPSKKLPTGEYYYDVYVCYDGDGDELVGICTGSYHLYANSKQRLFITVE